ncbi:MAG: hypothetical protein HC765_08310 [Brachymonas sp.]|nr:hypothetical protein [Brachymonas sp.]
MEFQGTVIAGHGVASGRSAGTAGNPYPQGSIAMQAAHFKSLGLDLSPYYLGTINLDIAPHRWQLLQADHRFEHLRWTDLHPPETFSFVRIELQWRGAWRGGWLYYPHPETKAAHFQNRSVMELIAPSLEGLHTQASLQLRALASRLILLK